MTRYSILLQVEGVGEVEIKCKNKSDYDKKSELCQNLMPDKDWKEMRKTKTGKILYIKSMDDKESNDSSFHFCVKCEAYVISCRHTKEKK